MLFRNRFMLFVLALCLTGLVPSGAKAWGSKGHRIIAQVTWTYLSPADQEEIKKLLNGEEFVSASTWADEMNQEDSKERRKERRKEIEWHFVAIPLGESFDEHDDCKGGDCVVKKIEEFKKTFANPTTKADDRRIALKYLIHLVGDIHQPLHCADNGDQRGNQRTVTFFGNSSNLHKVWDIDMIERTGLGEGRYVEVLSKRGYNIESPAEIAQWANQSNRVAQRYAYRFSNSQSDNVALGLSYYQYCLPAVDLQLATAGIRLKVLLQEALGEWRSRPARPTRR